MPTYRIGHGIVHIRFSGKARKNPPKACPFFVTIKGERVRCMAMAPYLCDFPGCDVPICEDHVLELGPEIDVCPTHNARRGLLSRLLPAAPEGVNT